MKKLLGGVALLCACSSSPEKQVTQKPTPDTTVSTAQLLEMSINGTGELDAVSAKYSIGDDTIKGIWLAYRGTSSIDSIIPERGAYAEMINGRKARPVREIVRELAERYRLPQSVVGSIIYDVKVITLAGQAKESEQQYE